MRHRPLERLSEATLIEAIAHTPLDHFVIWDGSPCGGRTTSLRSRALACIQEVWTPVPLRALLQRAAALGGELGLDPNSVRSAVRLHQSARPAAYLLVQRTIWGEYVAVTDVPWPASGVGPLRGGDLILDRLGRAFGRVAAPAA